MSHRHCILLIAMVFFLPLFSSKKPYWINDGKYAAFVFGDGASTVEDDFDLTRDAIQLGSGNPIALNGYALFDSFGNVVSGSLFANGVPLWYDTAAFANFSVAPLFQNTTMYPQTIFLSNGFVFFFGGQSYTSAQIASGAVVPTIQSNNVVYHKGTNTLSGFNALNGGFTILPDASVNVSSLMTATGPLDFRETGTLILNGNLNLASHLTLSSGGGIYGNGKTLYLTGNTWLPSSKTFHIMNDTVINGNGYTLTIGDYGQLFVDNAVTLTLQNITLKSGAKTSVFPPLRCAGPQSNLVLDDTSLAPGADIPFYQGKMFIYDSVHFTGTSAFVYQSPQSTFIKSGAALYFDTSTTFSFTPATASNNQIVMSDATSQLVLNGCKLKITDTGMRLTKGTLTYQGSVTVDTKNSFYFSSLVTTTMLNYGTSSSVIHSEAWSPDSRYLAIGGYNPGNGSGGFANTDELRIYKFNGVALTVLTSQSYGTGVSGSVSSIQWTPDGRYLAIGGYNPTSGKEIQVYQFNGTTLTLVTSLDYGNRIYSLAWSSDGNFLALGGGTPTSGNELQVYQFNGTVLTFVESKDYGSTLFSVAWSPDGKYLALGGESPTNGNELQVYQFNGITLTLAASQGYGRRIDSVAWNPDGRYLAIGGYNPSSGNELQVYQFNGSTLTLAASQDYGVEILTITWSPNGRYLAIGGGVSGNELQVYQFNGMTLTSVISQDYGDASSYISSVVWSPDGRYLAIGGVWPSAALNNSEVRIYTPVLGANPNSQAQTNSLVYGNPALGSSANLAVSGNYSTLRGTVLNQNV